MIPDRYPYQEHIHGKVVECGKTAVIAPPGAGKTRPIIDALIDLNIVIPPDGFPKGPVFIMCTGTAFATWFRQFPMWADDPMLAASIYVVTGMKADRMSLWQQAAEEEAGIYITNFDCFRRDYNIIRKIPWAATIADEYHKAMRRRKSKTFKLFRSFTRHQEVMILASGSVWSKEPGSMWTAFALIDPNINLFRSYWRYVNTFCHVEDGPYGKDVFGIKNVAALKTLMDRYFAYIPEEVVADQLPEGRRVAVDVIMTSEQDRIYWPLADEMVSMLDDGGMIVASSAMEKLLRLRQLLCCPKLLDPSLGLGAGFELVRERMEDDPHVMIFVPFREACDHVAEALRGDGFKVDILRGGMSAEIPEVMERFRKQQSVIVCTIQFAESFDAETCNKSYFLGYDYNIDPNAQAEGRTRRAISKHKFVTWNYIKYSGTIDELLLARLEYDMDNVKRVLGRPEELINALRGDYA